MAHEQIFRLEAELVERLVGIALCCESLPRRDVHIRWRAAMQHTHTGDQLPCCCFCFHTVLCVLHLSVKTCAAYKSCSNLSFLDAYFLKRDSRIPSNCETGFSHSTCLSEAMREGHTDGRRQRLILIEKQLNFALRLRRA